MRTLLKALPCLLTVGIASASLAQESTQAPAATQVANTTDTVAVTEATPMPDAASSSDLHDEAPDEIRMISHEDRALNAVTRPVLTPFSGEGEFRRYLRRLEAIRDQRSSNWIGSRANRPAPLMGFQDTASGTGEVCAEEECLLPDENDNAEIVLTGTRATRTPSITNNQTAGVDEGDIVKQIGDYLLVLQDGRIFSLNLRTMQRSDWIEAYRRDEDGDPIGADWYDEMLVQDDHILITAYSYEDDATELSVFKLDQASGRLSRLGVFLLSSDDYYSADNYATRIVGDRLVMYAPYELDALEDRRRRPVIRRWQGPEEREETQRRGRPLIDARQLYWPVMRVAQPSIHTISICPLSQIENRDLSCRTTGFVAPQGREMFVSPEAAYLWTTTAGEGESWEREACGPEKAAPPRAAARDVAPGVIYRVPIDGGEPSLLAARGMVFDQFGMDEFEGRFRGLAAWTSERCSIENAGNRDLALVDVPLSAFSDRYTESDGRGFQAVPAPAAMYVENRFIDNWLVYGGRGSWRTGPDGAENKPQSNLAVALPLRNPQQAQVFEPGHGNIRIERIGNDAVLNGYSDAQGLHVTILKLAETARIGGQIRLDGRFESESRSHAFNAMANLDGSGVLGIPTVQRSDDAERQWWRSEQSEISFLGFDPSGALTNLGALTGLGAEQLKLNREASSYECEVSCVDWYGNTRPIFTLERIFGLMETEVVEARIENGAIGEVRRVDLTLPWPGEGRANPAEDDEDK